MDWTGLRRWHFILSVGIELHFMLPPARITRRRKDEKKPSKRKRP